LETLKSIYNSILVRNRLLSSGLKFELLPRIVLLIDEWYLLSAIGEKTFQSDIQTYLRRIVAVGRSANVSVILATQRPTSQNIDVTTRELCNTRIAFYCGDIHASEAILGQSGAEDKTNPLRQGEALVWINGHLERTTLFQVPNPLENSGFNYSNRLVTLEEVKEKENNLCQKYGIS
jgi:DNA helicase HerA-like ATPase